MNYSPIFAIAARIERAYEFVQGWIVNDAPVLEQRLKRFALNSFVTLLEFALDAIDLAQNFLEYELPIYQVRFQLAIVNTKRFLVGLLIKAARFNERHQLTAKAAELWNRKGAIARNALDTVFALN